MKSFIILATFLASALLEEPVSGAELLPETINSTLPSFSSGKTSSPVDGEKTPDPAVVNLQVLLDRAGASPGVIDGYVGENLSKAVAGFEAMHGLPVDGKLDPDVTARLKSNAPVAQSYKISNQDTENLVKAVPDDYGEKAKMSHLGYTSVAERLSEHFHMDIDLLKALNPRASFTVGETISVVMPGPAVAGEVRRIEVNARAGQIFAYGDGDALLAVFPATVGSSDTPAPSGSHTVNGVVKMPTYTYNPKVNFKQGENSGVLQIPSGPNGPVGTVWIDLSKPTYGIHGTPEPSLIDKVGSHGCVRLANWDVEELAGMVKPGVRVDFVE